MSWYNSTVHENSCHQSFSPVLLPFVEKITIHTEMLAAECTQAADKDVIKDPSRRNVPVLYKHLASVHETFSCSTLMAICFSDLSDLLSLWHI